MTNPSKIWNELQSQKAVVLSKIANSSDDNNKLRNLTEWIHRELDLETKYNGIFSEAERLIAEQLNEKPEGISGKPNRKAGLEVEADWTFYDLSKQERVKIARRAYFKRLEQSGIRFEQVKGKTIFRRKSDDVSVGVTFSIDKTKTDKEWFLGLPEKSFQEAVLLCQSDSRSVKVVHLKKEFCEKFAQHLSVDKNGQVKFNILRDGNKWLIEIPQPIGVKDITDSVESNELVCIRHDCEFA
jgi:hypothetical protein